MKPLHTTAVLLIICYLLFITSANAQPGAVDLTFKPAVNTNGSTMGLALQPDGKILVAQNHLDSAGNYTSRVVRLLPDGSADTTFYTGNYATKPIEDIVVQSDGKILIAGLFKVFAFDTVGYLTRLNSDGTRDTTFNTGSGFNSRVYDICQQADGKIIACGNYSSYNGFATNRLTRLNTDGSLDNGFNTGTGANGSINAISIQPDGKILVGGDFTSYDGAMHYRMARTDTDGSRDSTFGDTSGASAYIVVIEQQPDGKILVGGQLNTYDLQPREKIARLMPNNGLDPMFFSQQGANNVVRDIKWMAHDKIIVAGDFSSFKGSSINRLVRVNDNCNIDSTFNTGSGANGALYTLAIQPDGRILAVGWFTEFNGVPCPYIVRIYNCLTPQPDSIYGNSYALCSGTPQTYSVTPVQDATKYEWTLPNGWTGSSDSTSITAVSNGMGGTISVKAYTDSCGYSYATTRLIATIQPDAVPLCMVTVDTQSTHNIVLWEKPQTALIDSFFVYRETTSNVYTKIAALPYNALSEYHDTAANPNATSYRYKLSVLDTCGAESDLSLYHSTIHLQNLGNGNFQWTFYNIENTANPVTSFNVYRDAFGNGNWFPIGNVPGTNSTFTDVTANSFPNALYVVDVNWGISCDPGRAVNTTRSNIKHKGIIDVPLATGDEREESVRVYPNPAKDNLRVMLPDGTAAETIKLINSYGQLVKEARNLPNGVMSLHGIPAGVYGLWIETNAGRVVRKVVIE